jgi:deoxyhypusine synthase
MKSHKNDFLSDKIKPLKIEDTTNIDELLQNLKNCGFQGKNLGIALDILYKMVSDRNILTVLSLSGAMIPAGMGEIILKLIENNFIDIIVTTGANLTHDLVDTFTDGGHYIGSKYVDDNELFKHRINRIYDVFLPEENYKLAEKKLLEIIQMSFKSKEIKVCPSDFLNQIGNQIKKRCILSVAANHKVPIFVPAFSDSELALDLILYAIKEGFNFQFDILRDVRKYGDLIKKSNYTGTFIIGGGVPRNWTQQIFPLLDQIEDMNKLGFDYSVRIHTAVEYDGGLSGCTISESKSWGKYALDAQHISVWCDATIALPILILGLIQRIKPD